jgi:hypothetical protein
LALFATAVPGASLRFALEVGEPWVWVVELGKWWEHMGRLGPWLNDPKYRKTEEINPRKLGRNTRKWSKTMDNFTKW